MESVTRRLALVSAFMSALARASPLRSTHGHRPGAFILTPVMIFGPGRDDIEITRALSVGDIDADAMQPAQLIGTVPQGIEPELAVEGPGIQRAW